MANARKPNTLGVSVPEIKANVSVTTVTIS